MKIITQKELASLAEDAFKNADKHGFYTESTEIETELMLIITEMAEAVQADRQQLGVLVYLKDYPENAHAGFLPSTEQQYRPDGEHQVKNEI